MQFSLRPRYSAPLCSLLQEMLKIDKKERPTFEKTFSLLSEIMEPPMVPTDRGQTNSKPRGSLDSSRLKPAPPDPASCFKDAVFVSHRNKTAWRT